MSIYVYVKCLAIEHKLEEEGKKPPSNLVCPFPKPKITNS